MTGDEAKELLDKAQAWYDDYHDHPAEIEEVQCDGCKRLVSSRFMYVMGHNAYDEHSLIMAYCIGCDARISSDLKAKIFTSRRNICLDVCYHYVPANPKYARSARCNIVYHSDFIISMGSVYKFLFGAALTKYVLEDIEIIKFVKHHALRRIVDFFRAVIEFKYRPENHGYLEAKQSFTNALKSF